jgi:hypothetical protein
VKGAEIQEAHLLGNVFYHISNEEMELQSPKRKSKQITNFKANHKLQSKSQTSKQITNFKANHKLQSKRKPSTNQ